MTDYKEFAAKTVDEAITRACSEFGVSSDKLDYTVKEEGSNGLFGLIGAKPAVILARKILTTTDIAVDFLTEVFRTMNMEVHVEADIDPEEESLNIDLSGDDMGVLIGKRGQTLDSLQYLTSLVVNKDKDKESHLRVKMDTENYRERRKATLENLAKNIASKVKRTKRTVSLEPMNPYERRIIHSILQNDKYVTTKSEGEEPYRHVIVSLKKEPAAAKRRYGRYDHRQSRSRGYNRMQDEGNE